MAKNPKPENPAITPSQHAHGPTPDFTQRKSWCTVPSAKCKRAVTKGAAAANHYFDASSITRFPTSNLNHHPLFALSLAFRQISRGRYIRHRSIPPGIPPSFITRRQVAQKPAHAHSTHHTHLSCAGNFFNFLLSYLVYLIHPWSPIQGSQPPIMNSASGRAGIIRARDDAGSMDKLVSRRFDAFPIPAL